MISCCTRFLVCLAILVALSLALIVSQVGADSPAPSKPAPRAQAQPDLDPERHLDPLLRSTNPNRPVPSKPSPLVAEPAVADMGMIPPDSVKDIVIQIRNPTDQPITIERVVTTCKCTTTEPYEDHVLAPGQSIPVKVTYKATSGLGVKNQTVSVLVKSGEAPLRVPVNVEVVNVLRAIPAIIKFFEEQGDVPTGELTIESLDGKTFTILSSGGKPPVYADDFLAGAAPRNSYRVRFDLTPWITSEPINSTMPWWWMIETDRPEVPVLDVRIRSMYTAPLMRTDFAPVGDRRWNWAGQFHVNAGVFKPGDPTEVLVPTRGLGEVKLVKVIPMSTDLVKEAEIVGNLVMDGERVYSVRLTIREGVRGPFLAKLMFMGSDDNQTALWIMGTARE